MSLPMQGDSFEDFEPLEDALRKIGQKMINISKAFVKKLEEKEDELKAIEFDDNSDEVIHTQEWNNSGYEAGMQPSETL